MTPIREPSGRLSRAAKEAVDASPPAAIKRLRDAALRGAADEEWGTELGRLFLTGDIRAVEYEAGRRWGRLVDAWHEAIGAKPPYAKPQTFERFEPSADADEASDRGQEQVRRDRAIIADMKEAHAVLTGGAGRIAEKAVRSVCESNESAVGAVEMMGLKLGLSWLAEFWQLTPEPKRNNGRRVK